jgi:redox-sensitive bicupin YhaK (pirin superfamily)
LFSYGRDAAAFDPFLLLDFAGPYEFAPSEARRGVGEHPHRGFETVTIVYSGELEHRDSAGNHGTIGPGDVQWMTAASGVVHEEFHSRAFAASGGTFQVMQLWVNLPGRHKMSPPRYQELRAGDIPSVSIPGSVGSVRVIAGELFGKHGPAKTFTPINLWDVALAKEPVELPVPDGHTTLAAVQSGEIEVNSTERAAGGELIRFDRCGDAIALAANGAARVLVLSGQPIGEPVFGQGPFVMNTQAEIRQAAIDYRSGKMGSLVSRR